MNYHFVIDEKFIDGFINDSNRVSTNDTFICLSKKNDFIKNKKVLFYHYKSEEFESILSNLKEEDRIYIHWYYPLINKILDKVSDKIEIYLFFWGGDFLSMPLENGYNNAIAKYLYDEKSLQYLKKQYYQFLYKKYRNT